MLLWKKNDNFAAGSTTINYHFPDFRAHHRGIRSHFGICNSCGNYFIMSRKPSLQGLSLAPLSTRSLGVSSFLSVTSPGKSTFQF